MSPILLALWGCRNGLDHGTEMSPGHRHCQGWNILGQERSQGLKKGLLEKLDCQQVLKGWKVWGVGREEEEEGRALLEGAQQDQSQEGQPSYSFIIHPTHVLQSLWGVPG